MQRAQYLTKSYSDPIRVSHWHCSIILHWSWWDLMVNERSESETLSPFGTPSRLVSQTGLDSIHLIRCDICEKIQELLIGISQFRGQSLVCCVSSIESTDWSYLYRASGLIAKPSWNDSVRGLSLSSYTWLSELETWSIPGSVSSTIDDHCHDSQTWV